MSSKVPIMTCGDHKPDAIGVHAGMMPEYEVVYAGFSPADTLKEVPKILAGSPPSAEALHTQVASKNFTQRPVAVLLGGGYKDEAYEALRNASIEACGSKQALGVVFCRVDNEITDLLVAEGKSPEKRTAGYPEVIIKRFKDKMAEVGVPTGLREQDVGELIWF